MFGSLFNTAEVDRFADLILAEVKRSLPPGYVPGIKNIEERTERLNVTLAEKTGELQESPPCGPGPRGNERARIPGTVHQGVLPRSSAKTAGGIEAGQPLT